MADKTLEAEVYETLGIGSVDADDSAAAPAEPVAAPAAQAGDGVATPSSSPEPAEPAPAAPPAASEPAPAPASSAPAEPSPAPATPAAAPSVDDDALRRASLEAQVDALTRDLEQLRASPPVATPAAEPGQPQEQLVRYGLTLPPQVQEALQGDDPVRATAAINQIVNDLGTIVHNSVVKQVRAEVGELFRSLQTTGAETESATTREAAIAAGRDQYFKAFPAHNNELVAPLIAVESRKMAAEFPHLKWGPDYVNALGTRVNNTLATLRGEAPASPEPTPKPAVMMPSGTRAAVAPTGSQEESDLIMDTFDVFGSG